MGKNNSVSKYDSYIASVSKLLNDSSLSYDEMQSIITNNSKKLKKEFMEKVRDISILMSNYCSIEETSRRNAEVIESTNDIVRDYSNLSITEVALTELIDNSTAPQLIIEDALKIRQMREESENFINSLLKDDLSFLRFFTKYGDHRGFEYKDGDKTLFSGMNKAFEYSLMSVLKGIKKKNKRPYMEAEEIREYNEQTPLRSIQIRDIVSIDLMDAFGSDNVVQMYFKGQGEKLYNWITDSFAVSESTAFDSMNLEEGKTLEDYASEKTTMLSDVVDESVKNNNETNFFKYSNLMKEIIDVNKELEKKDTKKHNM